MKPTLDSRALKLERLELRHERQVAMLLVRAFIDDPLVRVICQGGASHRARQMEWSFRMSVRSHCLSPQPAWVLVAANGLPAGVILVSRPSMALNGRADVAFTLQALLHLDWRTIRRGLQAGGELLKHAPPTAFTYIRTLGVDPDRQHQGVGTQLLRHAVHSSPTNWPIYLETAKESNLTFYQRQGLQCIGEFNCFGVKVWRLLRPSARKLTLE